MTFGIKVVFRADFEERNKSVENPEDWSADGCWKFLTEAGQPVEFKTESAARGSARTLAGDWSGTQLAPIAWKLVGIADRGEPEWRT